MFILTTNSRKLSLNAIIQWYDWSVLHILLKSNSQSIRYVVINVQRFGMLYQANWHAVRGMIVVRKQKSAFKNKSMYLSGLIIRRTWIHLYSQWSKSSTFSISTFYTVAKSFSLLYNITEWNVLVFISYQNTLYLVKRTAINLFINTERLDFCESTIF